jgi:hypothetical protein
LLLQSLEPLFHHIDLVLRGGDPAFRLLLKGVDDSNRVCELKRIDNTIGIAAGF